MKSLKVLAWPAFRNGDANPYNKLLYESLKLRGVQVADISLRSLVLGDFSLFHVHWPEGYLNHRSNLKAFLGTMAVLGTLCISRLRRKKNIWTGHNFKSHENHHPLLSTIFWRAFPKLVDGVISLSAAARERLLEIHPELKALPCFIIPGGHYRDVYPNVISRAAARKQLGIPESDRVVLFFGLIRPYKGVPHLINLFRRLADPGTKLVIAGKPDSTMLGQEIRGLAGRDSRVTLDLRFIPVDELQVYLKAADVAVLPFNDMLNSGSALLALSFECPVIVPAFGSLLELQNDVGEYWVRSYEGSLDTEQLSALIATGPGKPPLSLEAYDWERIARLTLHAYDELQNR